MRRTFIITVDEEMSQNQLTDIFNDTYNAASDYLAAMKRKQIIEANLYLGNTKKLPINQ